MKPVIVIDPSCTHTRSNRRVHRGAAELRLGVDEETNGEHTGSRLYRGLDDRTVVLVSEFESIKAQEEIFQSPAFKENLSKLQAFVESSSPAIYEGAEITDGFNIHRDGGPAFGESPRRLQENRDADHVDPHVHRVRGIQAGPSRGKPNDSGHPQDAARIRRGVCLREAPRRRAVQHRDDGGVGKRKRCTPRAKTATAARFQAIGLNPPEIMRALDVQVDRGVYVRTPY